MLSWIGVMGCAGGYGCGVLSWLVWWDRWLWLWCAASDVGGRVVVYLIELGIWRLWELDGVE